jgi:YidC/Oxa1 family membrane protein insertase
MFSYIWHTFFFDPIYNLVVFFIDIVPGGDVGVAIIASVFVVKTILMPLAIRAAKTQRVMKEIEPKLKAIKEEFKDDREGQAKAMMEVYRSVEVNPFASIFLLFLQIPILIALYLAVNSGGGVPLPAINVDALYSFVMAPVNVSMDFLGLINITERSVLLAVAAGVSQYIYTSMTLPKLAPKTSDTPNMKEEFMRNMHLQMKYVMPVIIGVIAYTISAAIALYFLVSSVVGIGQEYFIKKHR